MNALVFENTGEPQTVLQLKNLPVPKPGPGQLLVRVKASPIHPADLMFIAGKYRYKPIFPQVAGLEGAGIVEAAGLDTHISEGSLVAFSQIGAWAEYVIIDEETAVLLPGDFPVEKAAQLLLNAYTAWGLIQEAHVKAGDWLLLTAGNSAVSKIVIQLASARGVRVIATVRDTGYATELIQLGADAVLQQHAGVLQREIMEITGGKGVLGVLDAVGGAVMEDIFAATAAGAHVIIYGLLDPNPACYYNAQVIFKNLSIKGFGVRGFVASLTSEEKEQMIRQLIQSIGSAVFQLPVAAVYPAEQFVKAFEHKNTGKVLLKFDRI